MKLTDFKGVGKTQEVEFISAVNVSNDYYEIRLKKPEGFKWEPGKHAIFSIPNKKISGRSWRAFSIASTPKEGVILLGTRTGKEISSFKKAFLNLNEGETVKMRGPFGGFTLKDHETPLVIIALGVGVTPIRSLLTKLEHQHHREVNVVYSSLDYYMFKERIQAIIDHNDTFTISYTKSITDTTDAYLALANKYGNSAQYYISGPNNAIKAVKQELAKKDIDKSRIIIDPFLGY